MNTKYQIPVLLSGPFDTDSGYGHKAREIADAVIKLWKGDVRAVFLPWGHCASGALAKNKRYEYIKNHRVGLPLPHGFKTALHIHIGVPDDFHPLGEKNILFTSGVETDRISYKWISDLNSKKIDLIVVPSTYVKNVMEQSVYVTRDQQGKEQKVSVRTPIVVASESFEPEFLSGTVDQEFINTTEEFFASLPNKVFFSAGQIVPRPEPYDDRKGLTKLVTEFIKTFRGDKDKALILKLNGLDDSNITKRDMTTYFSKVIKNLRVPPEEAPQIYYLHGHYTDAQLYYIMNHPKVISHVYLTHGEGFGRFILQSTLCDNKAIILPRKGGHRDFTHGKRIKFLDGEFKQIPNTAHMGDILIPESQWFNVTDADVYDALKEVARDPKRFIDGGKLYRQNASLFDIMNVQNKITEIVSDFYQVHKNIPLPIGSNAGGEAPKRRLNALKPINLKHVP